MRILTIVVFLFLYIFIRSVNFSEHLNFSYDQAWFSTIAREIWLNREFTLVGPGSSLVVNGKQVLYGSINYYFQLLFLLFGNFDPISSSYAFMLFSAIMLVPLYYGVKLLADKKTALLITGIYTLAPLYIDFSRFFFAPNFQLSLTPLLLLFMGLHKKTGKSIYFFLTFFLVGVLMQFHFAILLLYLLLSVYYLNDINYRNSKLFFISLGGFLTGILPLIIFELKNNFYNFRVFAEYLQHAGSSTNFEPLPHRYLVISFVLIVLIATKFRQYITDKATIAALILIFIFDLVIYLPKPTTAFGMSENWNYPLENKAYRIIKNENLKDYNVSNLIYDNLAVVIKYLLKKDNLSLNYDDYYRNKFLYIISKNESEITKSRGYEVKTFVPRKKVKQWQLNDTYNLYLFARLTK